MTLFVPNGPPRFWTTDALESFIVRTEVTPDCWNWTGTIKPNGYGVIWDGQNVYAHRWSFQAFVGRIPEGAVVDHVCNNKRCVKPGHLRLLSNGANIARAFDEFCSKGHPRTTENTGFTKKGTRRCRDCERERDRKRPNGWQRKKAKEGK